MQSYTPTNSFFFARVVAIGILLLAGITRADDAAPPLPADQAPSDEQIHTAEVKARQTEVEYVKAQLELLELKHQQATVDLKARLQEAEDALEALTPAPPTPAPAVSETEGFVHKWLLAGPIPVDAKVADHNEAACKEMLDRAYISEDARPVDGEKLTIDGQELTWKSIDEPDYSVELSKLAEDANKSAENAAYIGVVYVTSEQEVPEVRLSIGSDDDSVWRLNGQEVVRAYEARAVEKDQNASEPLTLKAGKNVLTFTVLNGDGPSSAAARFLDKDGNAVKGLAFSATP